MRIDGPGQLSRYSDSLRTGRSGDRISVGGEIFRTRPDQLWGPSSPLYNGHRVSFLGVKRPGRGADYPPQSKWWGHERVGLYLYSPSGPSWPVMGAPLSCELIGTDGSPTRARASLIICTVTWIGQALVWGTLFLLVTTVIRLMMK